MKKIIGLIALLGLTACGSTRFEAVKMTCSIEAGVIICPDGSESPLPQNGVDGRDGQDGTDGVDGRDGTLVDVIDPCGDGPGVDEVLLQFNDGLILAWYKDLGFSVLTEGNNYQTTDAQKCKFTILNGEVISQDN